MIYGMNVRFRLQILLIGVAVVILGAALSFLFIAFGSPDMESTERFVVPITLSKSESVEKLEAEGFIRRSWAFRFIHLGEIEPGAYRIEPGSNAFAVSRTLSEGPYMKWVVIPEGYRKEQIAEVLAQELLWSREEVAQFVTEDTALPDRDEGVYFPDTYLIPLEESTSEVAERLRQRFEERFAPYAEEALRQNIRWPTLIKVASLIQREAAGVSDMPLIAGILWNRLLEEGRLEIDATVQYGRDTLENYGSDGSYHGEGSREYGWWRPITVEDKKIEEFNTYLQAGLPSRPIANPGTHAIEAALFPEDTECYFYLHSSSGEIHCATTYEEHQENIERYL